MCNGHYRRAQFDGIGLWRSGQWPIPTIGNTTRIRIASRPVSRVLYGLGALRHRNVAAIHLGRVLPRASCNLPGRRAGNWPEGFPSTSLFGLAPGGVCRAAPVARRAVGSYPTLSPLPRSRSAIARFAFCGTFPGVAPAGCYPAPCFRGARTFLTRRLSAVAGAAARPAGSGDKGVCRGKRNRNTCRVAGLTETRRVTTVASRSRLLLPEAIRRRSPPMSSKHVIEGPVIAPAACRPHRRRSGSGYRWKAA